MQKTGRYGVSVVSQACAGRMRTHAGKRNGAKNRDGGVGAVRIMYMITWSAVLLPPKPYGVHSYPHRHIEAIGCAHIPFGEALSVYGWANVLCTCAPEAEGGTARCLSCAQAPSAPSARGDLWDVGRGSATIV